MELVCFSGGILDSNAYLLYQDNVGVLIDAGVNTYGVIKKLDELNVVLKYIILTHGHADHIYNANEIRKKTNAKIIAHENEVGLLNDPDGNCSYFVGYTPKTVVPDILVKDKQILKIANNELEFIYTPGHTIGGMCIRYDNMLFSGDTLFRTSVGRTDFKTGDLESLKKSIRNKLYTLKEQTVVYTGHGETTTIGYEKKNNFFVKSD